MSIKSSIDMTDVLNAFNLSSSAEIKKFPHPWEESHTFLVSDKSSRIVLRRWRGEERIGRMQVEAPFLVSLLAVGFNECARVIHPQSQVPWIIDGSGVGWTGYEYVKGKPLESIDNSSARIVGGLMARFHNATSKIMLESVASWDRSAAFLIRSMHQMLEKDGCLSGGEMLEIARFVKERIFPKLADYSSLPRKFIHGDLMLDNIIISKDSSCLIDFEFVREAPRMLDFASAFAPIRDRDGRFITAHRDYIKDLIAAYECEVDCRLSQEEISFLPVGAIIRACLIYEGMSRQASPYQNVALSNLYSMIEMNNC